MRTFFYFSAVYMVFALIVASTYMGGNRLGLDAIGISAKALLGFGQAFLIGIIAGLLALVLIVDLAILKQRVLLTFYALVATVLTQAGFTLLKNTMPFVMPYFADPFFADLDQMLHFGVDPWVIAHQVAVYLPADIMINSYLAVWGLPALALPVIVAVSDGDHARSMRTLIMYLVAWLLVGNVLALAGFSVGPVYYDRLLGTERFADLTKILHSSGVSGSYIGHVQQALWDKYSSHSASVGSGISAFPSVHVATATVTAIYMVERSKWLLPLAAIFLLSILFVSVFTGYHYAVDGYASIIIIFSLWWVLRRRNNAV